MPLVVPPEVPVIIAGPRGGWAALECWRPDIGAVPYQAEWRSPALGVDDWRQANIYRDGYVRARLNPSLTKPLEPGEYEIEWRLQLPILGQILPPSEDDMEPATDEVEVFTTIQLVATPAEVPDPSAYWTDADGLPTPRYFRDKYLFGVPPLDAEGRTMPDSSLQGTIDAAVKRVENRLGINIRPRVVSSIVGFDPPLKPDGTAYELLEEGGYDYDPQHFRTSYGFLQLRQIPVTEVLAMELWVGQQKVTGIPLQWLKLNGKRGQIQMTPGVLSNLSLPGSLAMPIVMGTYGGAVVPHLWHVAYKTGVAVDTSLYELITWIANQIFLIIISDSLIAGVASQSTSIDGVSESVSLTASAENSTYAANIKELDKRIENWFKEQADSYVGVRFGLL